MGGKSPKVPDVPAENMPSKQKCPTCTKLLSEHSIAETIECAKNG